jgi:hypothetical protein
MGTMAPASSPAADGTRDAGTGQWLTSIEHSVGP